MPSPLPASSPTVLTQGDGSREQAHQFFDSLGQWISEAGNFIITNLFTVIIWVFIIGAFGGWTLLGNGLRWIGDHLPGNKHKALERAERRRLERQREQALDEAHEKDCACGERCDGRKECEKHHPDCNCDHMGSFCVCQDEYECYCACRCDCKECGGYYKDEPLLRLPHSGAPGKERITTSASAATVQDRQTAAYPEGSGAQPVSWTQSRARFLAVCEKWIAYECDPHELLRLPALADVTFGPTATFLEAWYEANQLLTDSKPAQQDAAAKFVEVAERACNAWDQAVAAAERVADTRLNERERGLLRRAKNSLNLAENPGCEGERAGAYEQAARHMRELASSTERSRRWRLPEGARLEIQGWARPELTAGESADER